MLQFMDKSNYVISMLKVDQEGCYALASNPCRLSFVGEREFGTHCLCMCEHCPYSQDTTNEHVACAHIQPHQEKIEFHTNV